VDIPATSDNIPGTLVLRDSSGNLSAGTISADLMGDVAGELTGNVTGDVTGNVTGDLTGDVTGNVTGDLTGNVTGDVTGNVTGDLIGDVTGNVTGNSSTATALQTSRTIELSGAITGSASFDGTSNASITASIASGVIVDADISATAAIAGTKVSPDFGSQNVLTSGQFLSPNGVAFFGTVSNSGNGAIMQQGSNANGRWVRYADGTQLAFLQGVDSRTTSGTFTVNVTLPATFADAAVSGNTNPTARPYTATASLYTTVPGTATNISVNNFTTTTLEVRTERSNSTNTSFSLLVMGRWY